MKLSALRVFVRDLPEAKAFYRDVLGFAVKVDGAAYNFCLFEAGTADLLVETVPDGSPREEQGLVGRFTGASFDVEDIGAAHLALQEKGVMFTGAPERQYWGGTLATFKDPSGNELQLVQRPELLAR